METTLNKYQVGKAAAREKAINYSLENNNFSYYELAKISDYFYKIAKRYGLIKEFKENGII